MRCDRICSLEDISPLVEKILLESASTAPREQRMDIKLCLFELLSNAVQHRNYHANAVDICVYWKMTSDGVFFEIHSQGEAGPLKTYSRPILNDGCLLDESGRGLFLVSSLADSFSYSDDFRHIHVKLSW